MILPETYSAALLLSILSMLCWGSWANTAKLVPPKWRFELYYYDFAFGLLLAATIAAFTLGTYGKELSFADNVSITGRRQIFYAASAGIVFNLANILLAGAIAIAGMSVAFPIAIGMALAAGLILNATLGVRANWMPVIGAAALVLTAVVVNALAYADRVAAAPAAGKKRTSAAKGIAISVFSGVLMAAFQPVAELSRQGDIGLGAYSLVFFLAAGVFGSTFLFNFYFMNLPLQGEPVSFSTYFRGSGKTHLLGVLGGVIWCAGAIAYYAAASAPRTAQSGRSAYALGYGAAVIGALWGLFAWKEFAGASGKARGLMFASLGLLAAGLALVALR